MGINDRISTRIDAHLKEEAVKVFQKLGITEGEAIRLFYAQVYLHQGIPFKLTIPNRNTIAAMKEGEDQVESLPTYKLFSDIRKELGV
jgi:DNA-damage-inducible protein J